MENLAQYLRKAIRDLKRIDLDFILSDATIWHAETDEEKELLFELKSSIDDLRTSLWCHLKSHNDKEAIDFYRMHRITERLRQVSRVTQAYRRPFLEHVSPIECFESMAERALEAHGAIGLTQLKKTSIPG